MLLNCGVGEDSWESLGLQGDPTSPFWRRSALGFLWKEWCYSWNSSILATSCEELTHWKRLWCWERLGAGGEGDNRGWDGWMASWTRWTWIWVNSRSWWWTGRPGVLRFMGSQRVGHYWGTELNWTESFLQRKNNLMSEALAIKCNHTWLWLIHTLCRWRLQSQGTERSIEKSSNSTSVIGILSWFPHWTSSDMRFGALFLETFFHTQSSSLPLNLAGIHYFFNKLLLHWSICCLKIRTLSDVHVS